MTALVIPFPSPPLPLEAQIVIREGDEVWAKGTFMHLGKVRAIVGERVVYASRWGGPKVALLDEVIGVSQLPWQLRP